MTIRYTLKARCEAILDKLLKLLNTLYDLHCNLSCEELLEYQGGPTYEEDVVTIDEVF